MNSSFYSTKLSVDQLEDRAAPALLKASVSFILDTDAHVMPGQQAEAATALLGPA